MLKAYKYRIYPNTEQKIFLCKNTGCSRFVYNSLLADRIATYEDYRKVENNYINFIDYCKKESIVDKKPSHLKHEFEWLKEVDSLALCNAELNLNQAYKNFFRDTKVGYPKFKKKSNIQSYKTNNQKGTIFLELDKCNKKIVFLRIPKFSEKLKLKYHRKIPKNTIIKSVTLSKNPSGEYYASILIEKDEEIKLTKNSNIIGCDVGIKDFLIDSNGTKYSNPRYFVNSEKKLAKEQRKLSKKHKGSNNRKKQRLKVAKIHKKITNQRKDFAHKLSHKLVNENQVIVVENLRVKNMVKNSKLAKHISDCSWSRFTDYLEYKCKWYGRELIKAPQNYASSQLCSNCNHKNIEVKDLAIREWSCPQCNSLHDRDINASNNLLKLANER